MNAREIEEILKGRVEHVVKHLFPNCKINGNEAEIGSLDGEPGKSLKIHLSGQKIGWWGEFSGNESGRQLISLWHQARRNENFSKTLQEASKWAGVAKPSNGTFYARQKPIAKHYDASKQVSKLENYDKVHKYLILERKLTQKSIEAYKVEEAISKDSIFFPYYAVDQKTLLMGKFIPLNRHKEGGGNPWTTAQAYKCLFGKHVVPADGGDLYITEGEIDALSMFEMGYPAVSVPYGAKEEKPDGTSPNDEWIQNDFDWLDCFTRIFLCFDNDEPGQRAAVDIAKRLGRERCFMVKMPEGCKDANDVLRNQQASDLYDAIESAETLDPIELKNSSAFREKVWELFNPKNETSSGVQFFLDMPWKIRPSELTIWTGFSGHGKSEMLNHLAVYLGSLHQRSCIASFEIKPEKTLEKMMLQASGIPTFLDGQETFDSVFGWITQKIWIVDKIGKFSWRDLIEIMKYAAKRYRINNFVVDSLLRCGVPEDDYEQQKNFVDALVMFAMEYDVHVHLVAHSKKKDDEKSAPGKLDVKGSGSITDLAHNVVSVYRNKEKEDKINNFLLENKEVPGDIERIPDGYIEMSKQRETGEEPKQKFFFIRKTKQFVKTHHCNPLRYIQTQEQGWQP